MCRITNQYVTQWVHLTTSWWNLGVGKRADCENLGSPVVFGYHDNNYFLIMVCCWGSGIRETKKWEQCLSRSLVVDEERMVKWVYVPWLQSVLWHYWLGDWKGIRPLEASCSAYPKGFLWNKWGKKLKGIGLSRFIWKANAKTEVVVYCWAVSSHQVICFAHSSCLLYVQKSCWILFCRV